MAPPSGTSSASYIDIPNATIRQITADRLSYSKQNIPHYYLTMECNADKLLEYVFFFSLFPLSFLLSFNLFRLRTQLNNGAKDFKLSVNDFVIKAAANALKAHPLLNSEWKGK